MSKSMQEILASFPPNSTIIDAVIKTEDHLTRQAQQNGVVVVSISGGSDSDIMLDMIERIGYPKGLVKYVWFDTGLEYEATKRHLCDLERKYGIEILRRRPEVTVPLAVKRYGVPFVSKMASDNISILQKGDFDFTADNPIDFDFAQYKGIRQGIRFWHSDYQSKQFAGNKRSAFDIDRFTLLKEFMQQNPPDFRISDKCCYYAKKKLSKDVNKETGSTLSVIGVRQAEGGIRASGKTCYTDGTFPPVFRPLFWFSDKDKDEYKLFCGVAYSDCYEVWGFSRTGCVGCPFNGAAENDLAIAEQFEPLIVKACRNIFGKSYAYRAQDNAFKRRMKDTGFEQTQLEGFDD